MFLKGRIPPVVIAGVAILVGAVVGLSVPFARCVSLGVMGPMCQLEPRSLMQVRMLGILLGVVVAAGVAFFLSYANRHAGGSGSR